MLVTPCASHKLIFSWTFAVSSCQIIIYDVALDKQIFWGEVVVFNLELVDISYALDFDMRMPPSNAHTDVFVWGRDLIFVLSFFLLPYFVCVSGEGRLVSLA